MESDEEYKMELSQNREESSKKYGNFECRICHKSFYARNSYMATHMRTHTRRKNLGKYGEKRFKCDICSKDFFSNYMLTRHMRIHTGEKPYKCDLCQKSFSNRSTLTSHMRIHTGEKPYKCDIWQKTYSMKCNFNLHMRIHTGENTFKCDICSKAEFENKTNYELLVSLN